MSGDKERRGEGGPWDEETLTREDIGYGPARPYEFDYGPAMSVPRERRRGRRGREAAAPTDEGPYAARLRRASRPDPWIQADVEEALFRDTWVDADRISVRVESAVVTLTGTLASPEEARAAVADARRVPGVREVSDRLEVEP